MKLNQKQLADLFEQYPDKDYALAPGGKARLELCSRKIMDLSERMRSIGALLTNQSEEGLRGADLYGLGVLIKNGSVRLQAIHDELDRVDQDSAPKKAQSDAWLDHGFEGGYKEHIKHCDALRVVESNNDVSLALKYDREIKEAVNGTEYDNPAGVKAVAKLVREARVSKKPIGAKKAVEMLQLKEKEKGSAGIEQDESE